MRSSFLGGAGSANATTADDNVGLIVKKGNVAVKVTATRRPQKAGYRENARPAGCFRPLTYGAKGRIEACKPDEALCHFKVRISLEIVAISSTGGDIDRFAVYVFDRFIVPNLTDEQRRSFETGELQGDGLTRSSIQKHLSYRFVVTESYKEAIMIEAHLARGQTSAGFPLLNPRRDNSRAPAVAEGAISI